MDQSRKTIPQEPALARHLPLTDPAATTDARPAKRKYEIFYLDQNGHLQEIHLLAATLPAFEQVFSVLKQGAIVQSERGHIAVEDTLPGERLRLTDGSFEMVQWRGAITINTADMPANAPSAPLTRITADAFGFNRPSPDLVLGHGARLLHRAAGIRKVSGSDAAFIPAADFVDGNNLIPLQPVGPITLYQFGFHGQRALQVNGIAVETLHPGTAFNLGLRGEALRAFLALFPHKSSFEDFGLLHVPRLRLRDLDLLG